MGQAFMGDRETHSANHRRVRLSLGRWKMLCLMVVLARELYASRASLMGSCGLECTIVLKNCSYWVKIRT